MKSDGFLCKIINNKKMSVIIYIIVALVIIVLYIAASKPSKIENEDKKIERDVFTTETDSMEKKLAETLSKIRGAGEVKVMITYDTSSELVPAMSTQRQSSGSNNSGASTTNETESNQIATVTAGGEQQPVVITEIQPKVRGVIVIAEGAADISVKMNLAYATATVLGIEQDYIEVFEMGMDNK